jgi:Ca2+-binding RTX toxin-like protein
MKQAYFFQDEIARGRGRRHRAATVLGGAAAVLALCFAWTRSAAAQVIVPPGCFPYSGLSTGLCDVFQVQCGVPFVVPLVNCAFIFGTPCIDEITGNNITESTICGFEGADVIEGQGGEENISGGVGRDTLSGGAGSDEIFGGPNDDEIFGDDPAGANIFPSINFLHGGDGDDTLTGGVGIDHLNGDSDNDTISGGDGVDEGRGGPQNDSCDVDVETQTSC